MKKNLFVLALSAFVLTNAQSSYAIKCNEVDENEKKTSRVRSLLKPKPEFTKESTMKIWVPSAPMKPEQVRLWIKKINKKPLKYERYKVEDNTLWERVRPKPQSTKESRVPSAPMKPDVREAWRKMIDKKAWKYKEFQFVGDILWISE